MVDDVILNKVNTIERCVKRAREEYQREPASFTQDFTRQDAAILNIQRACEAAMDVGQHIIRVNKLGVPQSSRDIFTLLAQANWLPPELANNLKKMVGFRNIAVHDYQVIQLPIVINIITYRLQDFLEFSQLIMQERGT